MKQKMAVIEVQCYTESHYCKMFILRNCAKLPKLNFQSLLGMTSLDFYSAEVDFNRFLQCGSVSNFPVEILKTYYILLTYYYTLFIASGIIN